MIRERYNIDQSRVGDLDTLYTFAQLSIGKGSVMIPFNFELPNGQVVEYTSKQVLNVLKVIYDRGMYTQIEREFLNQLRELRKDWMLMYTIPTYL